MRHACGVIALSLTLLGPLAWSDIEPPYDVDTLGHDFRSELETKLEQLHGNYKPRNGLQSVSFTSDQIVYCDDGTMVPPETSLFQMQLSTVKKASRIEQLIQYFGCKEVPLFTEKIIREGTDLKPLELKTLMYGVYDFPMASTELERTYQLISSENEILFEIQQLKKPGETQMNISIQNQVVLREVIVRGEVNPKVSYWLSGFTSDFRRLGNHSRWNFNFTPFTQEIRKRPQGLIHFIDGQETTPASFRGQFDSIVINGYMAAARSFLSTYLRETPPTVFQGSGAKSTRFYGELEEIRTKLSSGSDLERVKILIQEFIDGLESGLLKVEDRRPAP